MPGNARLRPWCREPEADVAPDGPQNTPPLGLDQATFGSSTVFRNRNGGGDLGRQDNGALTGIIAAVQPSALRDEGPVSTVTSDRRCAYFEL